MIQKLTSVVAVVAVAVSGVIGIPSVGSAQDPPEEAIRQLAEGRMILALYRFRFYLLSAEQPRSATYTVDACRAQTERVECYQAAAEQGNARAQYELAQLYSNGEGVPKDNAMALRWVRAAAERGYPRAQYELGRMYSSGDGVSKDDAKAEEWLHAAGVEAQFLLGVDYAVGSGVPEDDEEAVRWYRVAAEGDYAPAQFRLGFMYAYGEGCSKTMRKQSSGTWRLRKKDVSRPSTLSDSFTPTARACRTMTWKPRSGSGRRPSRVVRGPNTNLASGCTTAMVYRRTMRRQ